ncbi:hypothetical protein AQ766_28315 [Burkholderia pseudomallei]|nr:hypothetical protein AQ766_28315 [Burkholderia pseudomallei]
MVDALLQLVFRRVVGIFKFIATILFLLFIPVFVKWSSNFGHCSGIGGERFETRWRQSLRSRVKATMVVKID